jgi:hypothetical protein
MTGVFYCGFGAITSLALQLALRQQPEQQQPEQQQPEQPEQQQPEQQRRQLVQRGQELELERRRRELEQQL